MLASHCTRHASQLPLLLLSPLHVAAGRRSGHLFSSAREYPRSSSAPTVPAHVVVFSLFLFFFLLWPLVLVLPSSSF